VDGGDVAAVRQRVGGLASPENPMRNAAREAIGLAQYQAGDLPGALATFEEVLADPGAGQDLISRVQVYAAQLQAMGAADPERPAAAAAGEMPAEETAAESAPTDSPAAEATATEEPAAEEQPAEAPADDEATTEAPADTTPAAEPSADDAAAAAVPADSGAADQAPAPGIGN